MTQKCRQSVDPMQDAVLSYRLWFFQTSVSSHSEELWQSLAVPLKNMGLPRDRA